MLERIRAAASTPPFGRSFVSDAKMAAATSKYMAERDPMRTFRLIGAAAAFLAVLGLAILGFWLMIRLPRF